MNKILPPLALYIHFPWCVQKCPYCDFNSHQLQSTMPEEHYVNALIQDLKADSHYLQGRPVDSIFMGGGTPSLFSPQSIQTVLQFVRDHMSLKPQAEITLEANPGTVDMAFFEGYLKAGVNRISLGVQSFSDASLKSLGRIHDQAQARQAIESVKQLGFPKFNIDIMYGLPQQDKEAMLYDLEQALAYETGHLSWYQLTMEPNTAFYHNPPARADHDTLAEFTEAGLDLIQGARYERYEISAHALPGMPCEHNLNTWQFGDYLGVGAGAHGKLTVFNDEPKLLRTMKHRHPKAYLQAANEERSLIQQQSYSKDAQRAFEFFLNHCRLFQPIQWQTFESRTFLPRDTVTPHITQAEQLGLLKNDASKSLCEITPYGYQYLDELTERFLPE